MTEVLFYHLTESKVEAALPPLLEKSLERGWRVSIEVKEAERRDSLDAHLWTWRDMSFLPHGTDAEDLADHQPILLTKSPENLNRSTVRFFLDGVEPASLEGLERAIFMFDGYDQDQLEAARSMWRRLKAEGLSPTYWQQTPEGRWQKRG